MSERESLFSFLRIWFAFYGALIGTAAAGPVYLAVCMATGFPVDSALPMWAVAALPAFPAAGICAGWRVGRRLADG